MRFNICFLHCVIVLFLVWDADSSASDSLAFLSKDRILAFRKTAEGYRKCIDMFNTQPEADIDKGKVSCMLKEIADNELDKDSLFGKRTFQFVDSVISLSIVNKYEEKLIDDIRQKGIGNFCIGAVYNHDITPSVEFDIIKYHRNKKWFNIIGIALPAHWLYNNDDEVNSGRHWDRRKKENHYVRDLVGSETIFKSTRLESGDALFIAESMEKLGEDYAKYYEEAIYCDFLPSNFLTDRSRDSWIGIHQCENWLRSALGRMQTGDWEYGFESLAKAYLWGDEECKRKCIEVIDACEERRELPGIMPVETDLEKRKELVLYIAKEYDNCNLIPRAIHFMEAYNINEMSGAFDATIAEYKERWRKEITKGLEWCNPYNFGGIEITSPDQIPAIPFPEDEKLLKQCAELVQIILEPTETPIEEGK